MLHTALAGYNIHVGQLIIPAGITPGHPTHDPDVLDFCAEHSIEPEIELIDVADINDAWERVLRSDVRYRFVIDASSLRVGQ